MSFYCFFHKMSNCTEPQPAAEAVPVGARHASPLQVPGRRRVQELDRPTMHPPTLHRPGMRRPYYFAGYSYPCFMTLGTTRPCQRTA
jgi:hypothetical protein